MSNVVKLDDYRRKEPRRHQMAEYSLPNGAGSLGEALGRLWLKNLEIAAKFATAPLWPVGIDDLKW